MSLIQAGGPSLCVGVNGNMVHINFEYDQSHSLADQLRMLAPAVQDVYGLLSSVGLCAKSGPSASPSHLRAISDCPTYNPQRAVTWPSLPPCRHPSDSDTEENLKPTSVNSLVNVPPSITVQPNKTGQSVLSRIGSAAFSLAKWLVEGGDSNPSSSSRERGLEVSPAKELAPSSTCAPLHSVSTGSDPAPSALIPWNSSRSPASGQPCVEEV
ncbi:hypothetical protein M231_07039 [Tremella mesenterica]|uniref:Uncharacterized protein n=1 Tax=Tremella mesenterica TaxID=5217 RepID=A0A4Q1BFW8_TREME|nr:hypothetical protein M231_07039 [Tremella mesenterica]